MDFGAIFFFFSFLRVNPKVIASLISYMMRLKIYKQAKEERKEKKRPLRGVALAVSSGRKL